MPTLHEIWREAYRSDPYLRHLKEMDLVQMAKHVVINITHLTADGRIALPALDATGKHWMKLFTDLHEDTVCVHCPFPAST
jgi:hypothetical protein